jgi:hypothetical protein
LVVLLVLLVLAISPLSIALECLSWHERICAGLERRCAGHECGRRIVEVHPLGLLRQALLLLFPVFGHVVSVSEGKGCKDDGLVSASILEAGWWHSAVGVARREW